MRSVAYADKCENMRLQNTQPLGCDFGMDTVIDDRQRYESACYFWQTKILKFSFTL